MITFNYDQILVSFIVNTKYKTIQYKFPFIIAYKLKNIKKNVL